MNAIKAFHDQPHEVKSKLYTRAHDREGVIYTSNYDLYRTNAATWHDSLAVWLSPEKKRAEEKEIPEICRKELLAWDLHSEKVAEALLESLSEGLEPIPGALTINIGDTIQTMSNDNYVSVEHRVLAKASKEPRISVVAFFNLETESDINYFGPLPELLTPDKLALYRKFTMPEFQEGFYSKGLNSKSFIQKIRL
ncbi:hypothetical protein SO802_025229 [Lithocarpus litseifolius]|uniref:Isopenicillin N synthase-like Fe(2+) 2OG dioxygenase domain-containing protein n=1 Tax=Lithocarpus litseifolius TaxID=425828 RepID=A0AAW2BZP6_9ROSI